MKAKDDVPSTPRLPDAGHPSPGWIDEIALVSESVERRRLVPSARQRDGVSPLDDEAVAPPVRRQRAAANRRQRARDYVDSINPRHIAGPKMPLFVFTVIALFGSADDLVFRVITPELRVAFASAPATLGLMSGAITAIQLAVMPFYGWLVDRVQRVKLLRLAQIGGNAVGALAAFAATPAGFVGARGAGGLLGRADDVPRATVLADYYSEESLGRVLTFLPAAQNVATILAPLAGGLLVAATNWRVAVLVLSVVATLAGCTTFLLREPARGAAERSELKVDEPSAEQKPLSFGESWRAASAVQTLRRIWFATPFQVAGTSATLSLIVPLYFSEIFGLTPAERGYVATLGGAAGLLALLSIGPLAGRLLAHKPGQMMTLMGGLMALQAVGMGILGLSNWLPLSVVASVLPTLAVIVMPPLQQMLTLKVVPPRMRGVGFSTTAPWTLAGIGVVYLVAIGGAGSARAMALIMVPVQLIGAFLYATGGEGVSRDVRAARASVLAEEAVQAAKESDRAKLLVCRDVQVAYQGTKVLFGVDLDVEDGEVVALLGTNGAGKSTLLRAVAGIHHPAGGAILFDGQDITYEPAHVNAAKGVVMMPGGRATFPGLTVRENLRAAEWLRRDDDPDLVAARREEVLDFFPILRERLDQLAGDLSGGEQQMVGLGQAFLMMPRLLMIDELSLGLAPAVVEQLLSILRVIHQQGTTVVLVEQSLNVALTIAGRAVFMEKGAVRFDGRTEDLLGRPDLIRSVFIGAADSSASRVRGRDPRPRRSNAPMEQPSTLAVRDVHLHFGGIRALDGVSLEVESGEVVGLIGPNGAGKTSLFDIVSGFTQPTDGQVVFDGNDITQAPPDARARLGIGRSFQNVRLFPALTVRENIAVALERLAVRNEAQAAAWLPSVRDSEAKIFRRVEGLIEILGLEAYADKFADELSTGSRRAVEVACVMAHEPRILLLDEPSSGLAQAETEALGPVLRRLVRDTNCGLLIIEHDMPLITSIADRLVAMALGRVLSSGPSQDVMRNPDVLAAYLSASESAITRSGPASSTITAALRHPAPDTKG